MKTEYGVPVPRGVPKDWRARERGDSGLLFMPIGKGVPNEWGIPSVCVAWFDRFNRCRLVVAHYENGKSALVRIDANGNWKTTFGDVA